MRIQRMGDVLRTLPYAAILPMFWVVTGVAYSISGNVLWAIVSLASMLVYTYDTLRQNRRTQAKFDQLFSEGKTIDAEANALLAGIQRETEYQHCCVKVSRRVVGALLTAVHARARPVTDAMLLVDLAELEARIEQLPDQETRTRERQLVAMYQQIVREDFVSPSMQ